MGVVYIGDRSTGKTNLVTELTNPRSNYVKVTNQDYEALKTMLSAEDGTTRATKEIYDRYLEIEARLPTRNKKVNVDWIDTPGEIWRKFWQAENEVEWARFLDMVQKSEGIIVILPPHRELIRTGSDREKFITKKQWCNRFNRWADFFKYNCSKARHIVLCLNMADLFCDVNQEAQKIAYSPNGSRMNWQQRHEHISNYYFRPILPQLETINRNTSGGSVRCFITSIYNRDLLELPWIYLASFLGK